MRKKRLFKLTNAQNRGTLYISAGSIVALEEVKQHYNSTIGNNGAPIYSTTSYDTPHPDTLTWVYTSNARFQVTEHIAVVTAFLKGEDPSPAQVIFGTE